MRLQLQILLFILVVGASSAWGTSTLMDELPTSERFRCLICHTVQGPGASNAELNLFGQAFQDNGLKWDEKLARERSDGDNCSNGFELGDENGDGELDGDRTEERSNPGEPGCTLQLREDTWTAMKRLFR
jgi:hypothetical protein